jgi:hypothetical protein
MVDETYLSAANGDVTAVAAAAIPPWRRGYIVPRIRGD